MSGSDCTVKYMNRYLFTTLKQLFFQKCQGQYKRALGEVANWKSKQWVVYRWADTPTNKNHIYKKSGEKLLKIAVNQGSNRCKDKN